MPEITPLNDPAVREALDVLRNANRDADEENEAYLRGDSDLTGDDIISQRESALVTALCAWQRAHDVALLEKEVAWWQEIADDESRAMESRYEANVRAKHIRDDISSLLEALK